MPADNRDLKPGCQCEVTKHTGNWRRDTLNATLVKIEGRQAVVDIEDGGRERVHLCNVLWVPSESEIDAMRLEIIEGWSPALERQHRGVRVKEDDGLEIPRVSVPTESRGGIKHD